MAEHAHSISTPTVSAAREDFDQALTQAQVINGIIVHLADASISITAKPCFSLFAWLAEELEARLERIEVADMTMRSTRA